MRQDYIDDAIKEASMSTALSTEKIADGILRIEEAMREREEMERFRHIEIKDQLRSISLTGAWILAACIGIAWMLYQKLY